MTRGEDRKKKTKQEGHSRRKKGRKSSRFVQKLDIKKNKKLLHRLESSNITHLEEDNLQTLTWMRKTSQPIHDGAHRKPGEIDEARTSGAAAQTISPLHAQTWLRSGFQNSRTGARVRRDTDNSGKNQEKKYDKIFPRKSRKERNKSKKAGNGNTNQITLISANVTSWKKNFNEIARLNPDIMAFQETKVTKAAKPAANIAAGSENYSVIWGQAL